MVRLSNEAKIGLTVIGALIVAFIGYRIMRDVPMFRQNLMIEATFDRVDGLNPGSYVYINGVKVGSVNRINLQQDEVTISMTIDLNNPIPRGSVAYLRPIDMLGSKAIVIERGNSSENVEYGGEIKGVYVESMVETLKDQGEVLGDDIKQSFGNFNTMLERLNQVVSDKNRDEFSATLKNLRIATRQISGLMQERRDEMGESAEHLRNVLQNVDTLSTRNRERIENTLRQLETSSEDLTVVTQNLQTTTEELNTLLKKINNGDGSLGRMVNDPSLYNNLDTLSVEMKKLIRNVQDDPARYLKNMRLIEVF